MTRCGMVGIIGRPNAGKSTLLNAILGTHLSIVTNKPQTTRKRVIGIHTEADTQIIFVDTPGLIKPNYRLQRMMMGYVNETLEEVDVLCVIVDAEQAIQRGSILDPIFTTILEQRVGSSEQGVESKERPATILVINKMDAVPVKNEVLPLIEQARLSGLFTRSVAVSALENKEVDALVGIIKELIPEREFVYATDELSTLTERFFVSELIREAIFKFYEQEIPYATEVEISEFKETPNGKWSITADIMVERENQKGILIGKGGEALKRVGIEARKSIEAHLDHPIFLELFVKVRGDWRNDKGKLMELGY